MRKRNPTLAAVRAATALHGKWTGQGSTANWTVDAAEVIDQETGLPELIKAVRTLLPLTHYPACEGLCFIRGDYREKFCTCGAAIGRKALAKVQRRLKK